MIRISQEWDVGKECVKAFGEHKVRGFGGTLAEEGEQGKSKFGF